MDEQRHAFLQLQVPMWPPCCLAQWLQQFALLNHPFPLPTQPQVVWRGQAFAWFCEGGDGDGHGGLGEGGDGLGGGGDNDGGDGWGGGGGEREGGEGERAL